MAMICPACKNKTSGKRTKVWYIWLIIAACLWESGIVFFLGSYLMMIPLTLLTMISFLVYGKVCTYCGAKLKVDWKGEIFSFGLGVAVYISLLVILLHPDTFGEMAPVLIVPLLAVIFPVYYLGKGIYKIFTRWLEKRKMEERYSGIRDEDFVKREEVDYKVGSERWDGSAARRSPHGDKLFRGKRKPQGVLQAEAMKKIIIVVSVTVILGAALILWMIYWPEHLADNPNIAVLLWLILGGGFLILGPWGLYYIFIYFISPFVEDLREQLPFLKKVPKGDRDEAGRHPPKTGEEDHN